jgi:hypothetical protein
MTDHDLEYCLRRTAEYEATRDAPGFDEQKLLDMKSGCAHRREFTRVDLDSKQQQTLRELIERERLDLWM